MRKKFYNRNPKTFTHFQFLFSIIFIQDLRFFSASPISLFAVATFVTSWYCNLVTPARSSELQFLWFKGPKTPKRVKAVKTEDQDDFVSKLSVYHTLPCNSGMILLLTVLYCYYTVQTFKSRENLPMATSKLN